MYTSLLTIHEESTGMTPLHVAAKNGKSEFLKAVIANVPTVRFDDKDSKGNTVFHYAAQSSKETIEVSLLIKSSSRNSSI